MGRTNTKKLDVAKDPVWRQYRKTGSEKCRNELVERYLPLVKATAARVRSKLPAEVDLDDLVQVGVFGLISAIDGFNPKRGVKFETYCAFRVRGAILDEIRSLDWVPRLVRNRTTMVTRARASLRMESGETPEEHDVADALGVNMDEYERIERDARPASMVSMDRQWNTHNSDEPGCLGDLLTDPRTATPSTVAQSNDLRDSIIAGLSKFERLLIQLYYFKGMTMKQIGSSLRLSESRISQMHSAIVARIRNEHLCETAVN